MAEDIPPPPNVRWLVDLVGHDATFTLVERLGGTRVFVPKRVTGRSELVQASGLPAGVLAKLAAARGGELVKMPLCREWRVRVYRHRDGASYSAIARKVQATEGTVWRILNDGGMTLQLALPI